MVRGNSSSSDSGSGGGSQEALKHDEEHVLRWF